MKIGIDSDSSSTQLYKKKVSNKLKRKKAYHNASDSRGDKKDNNVKIKKKKKPSDKSNQKQTLQGATRNYRAGGTDSKGPYILYKPV